MTIERGVAGAFGLTDSDWMRHANPVSVWTRYSVLRFVPSFLSRMMLQPVHCGSECQAETIRSF
jgi:hypothetical protein